MAVWVSTTRRLALAAAVALVLTSSPAAAAAEHGRVAGSDRYDTAAQISASVPATPRVFVANGREFPDGLTGGAAAAHDGDPLLLVEADRIPAATMAALERLQPQTITVLGGEQAVTRAVAERLHLATGAHVTRLAGGNRFATAAAISQSSTRPGVDVVYVTSGRDFADAVAAASAAATARTSVLLVEQDRVPLATSAELERLAPRRVVVLGGTARISDAVMTDLGMFGRVERIAGSDRYGTSAALARAVFPAGASTAFLASGHDFPDALAGATAASLAAGPVLLVPPGRVPQSVADELRRLGPETVIGFGGPSAISSLVLRQAAAFADGSTLPAGDGNLIITAPTATLAHLQRRAAEMGANDLFVEEMTPALYRVAVRYGIDPTVMVAQSFHETGGGHFGRAVTPAHHNTCGLKVRNPVGPDHNPDDHATFASWEHGATAHAQHLYAYAGLALPPGERNIDPRWDWVYGKHRVTTMTELGGRWAPSPTYGQRVRDTALRLLAD